MKEGQDIYLAIQDYDYLMNMELQKELIDLLG